MGGGIAGLSFNVNDYWINLDSSIEMPIDTVILNHIIEMSIDTVVLIHNSSTAQQCTPQHCTPQHCTPQPSTAHHYIKALHSTHNQIKLSTASRELPKL